MKPCRTTDDRRRSSGRWGARLLALVGLGEDRRSSSGLSVRELAFLGVVEVRRLLGGLGARALGLVGMGEVRRSSGRRGTRALALGAVGQGCWSSGGLGVRVWVLVVWCLVVASGCTVGGLPADPVVAGEGPDLTISFGGDVNFHNETQRLLDDDPSTAFGDASGALSTADLAIVNLETAITGRGTPAVKRFLFRTDARAITAVKAAGVDAVSLANNHTLDYGRAGLADTLSVTRRGKLPTFGAGLNASQAYAPWRTTIRGIRVAVLGISQVSELANEWAAGLTRPGIAMAIDHQLAVEAVRRARRTSDVVIVVPHLGSEFDHCPTPEQRALAADLAAAGADVILGAHAHVLQGQGYLGRTFVAYGLGNLLFGGDLPIPETWRGGVLHLTLHGRTVVARTFTPTQMASRTRRPTLTPDPNAERARLNALRTCAALTPTPTPD